LFYSATAGVFRLAAKPATPSQLEEAGAERAADIRRTGLTKSERGPASVAASDSVTPEITYTLNRAEFEELHPLVQARIKSQLEIPMGSHGEYYLTEGIYPHAEIVNMSRKMFELEKRLGRSITWEEAERSITIDIRLLPNGRPMPRCAFCQGVTGNVGLTPSTANAEAEQMYRIWNGWWVPGKPF
jgi:hypothetical protein